MLKLDDNKIIEVANSSISMRQAAGILNLAFSTFKRHAERLRCYKPNQAGIGVQKNYTGAKETLRKCLEGKSPQTQTYKLKKYLIREGYKENKCEICGITDWNGKELNMELHHKNGVKFDHRLENLQILCPNCHAQTDTYRSKKFKIKKF